MLDRTRRLWERQDRPVGDRQRLYAAVAEFVDAAGVLYPGSYVDLAPSFVWPAVTYVDIDHRATQFFNDESGVQELLAQHGAGPETRQVRFIEADYAAGLDLDDGVFDLLISMYAGFVSESCTRYLRIGGALLVNPSHGDVAMASIDHRYRLTAVVTSRSGTYKVSSRNLDSYLLPRRDVDVTKASLHATGRGIAYTRSPFAYLFERVA